ncbi:MAG: restriction endonuclease subunit S [Ruminococcus sp.]|nr:restriction endonuclease subunit S [Ruminococcus sp.]
MGEWKKYKVSDIGKVVTGRTPKTSNHDFYGGSIPFLTPSDDMNVKYVLPTLRTLTESGKLSVKNSVIPADSVCVSCIGSDLGKVVITTEETVTNQQINSIIIDKSRFDVDFVYYSMIIIGKILNYNSKISTAVPIINKGFFSQYEIFCPPLEEQKQIASVLSALDDKIELNNRINKNLEEQAQAIFKSWFVNFEPFGGVMPEDWKITTLGEVCSCVLGGTPSRKNPEYWNGNISWINSGEVNRFRITSPTELITKKGLNSSSTKLLPEKTTVLAITGATLGQVSLLEIESCANQSVVGVIPNEILPYEYIFPFIKSNIKEITSYQTGGAQQHINKQNVESLPVYIPYEKSIENYKNITSPIYNMIAEKCFENQHLSAIRDVLLPQLMNGRIDVSEIRI